MPSPMFATQQMPTQPPQQVYSATQRPAKSVRVLPPVSSPMQQVKKSYKSLDLLNLPLYESIKLA